jgi:hypothetical protein
MFYEELLPIFQGRASARATITSNNLDEDTDGEYKEEYEDEAADELGTRMEKKGCDDSTVETALLLKSIKSKLPDITGITNPGSTTKKDDTNDEVANKNSSKCRPISIAPTSLNKKPKNIPYDYALCDYQQKKKI